MRFAYAWIWVGLFVSFNAHALPIDVRSGLALSYFEQQVKSEIGGFGTTNLVDNVELGLNIDGAYRLPYGLSVGLFLRGDFGFRGSSEYRGLDGGGNAQVQRVSGGHFAELWIGPLVRFEYWKLFAQLGYGAFGVRRDLAREDLPDENGSTSGTFRTSPSVAWTLALGGTVPLTQSVSLLLQLEYRIRYYDRRGGTDLRDGAVHGTQNMNPFIGVQWRG
jgi:hypothetical protein